ncbi:MAG: hypothetical protein C0518_11185 [Opitutus sp.]|nr:hypothetical protein [Opitutus sp.]
MNNDKILRIARGFALVAGGADAATGVGLVVLPGFTLGAMGVAAPGAEAVIFLRFVGVFVGAVGASYLVALASRRADRLWAVFRITTLFRLAAGSFVAWAVWTGRLEMRWLSVTITDGIIAGVQLWLLPREPRA